LNQESGRRRAGTRPVTYGRSPHMFGTTIRTFGRRLLRRTNDYTLWAFNPQPELTSRYHRG
jgi:hypothetical protein